MAAISPGPPGPQPGRFHREHTAQPSNPFLGNTILEASMSKYGERIPHRNWQCCPGGSVTEFSPGKAPLSTETQTPVPGCSPSVSSPKLHPGTSCTCTRQLMGLPGSCGRGRSNSAKSIGIYTLTFWEWRMKRPQTSSCASVTLVDTLEGWHSAG